jgi:transposase InsO family protein
VPVVGLLKGTTPAEWAPFVAATLQGLAESGFVAGRTVEIVYKWAEGQPDRLPEMAADLVRREVWVILASGGGAAVARAAKEVGHGRRQLLWFAVTRHPTAEWLARQLVEAFPWNTAPAYLVRDNDGAYGQAFRRRVRAMGIRDRPISPRSPWQNPYAERLIGTLRRDCLDHVLIFGVQHLLRLLASYSRYYNETRTHLSLDKDTPLGRAVQRSGTIMSVPILSGLHHCYARI